MLLYPELEPKPVYFLLNKDSNTRALELWIAHSWGGNRGRRSKRNEKEKEEEEEVNSAHLRWRFRIFGAHLSSSLSTSLTLSFLTKTGLMHLNWTCNITLFFLSLILPLEPTLFVFFFFLFYACTSPIVNPRCPIQRKKKSARVIEKNCFIESETLWLACFHSLAPYISSPLPPISLSFLHTPLMYSFCSLQW